MSEDAATDVAETASREPLGYKPPLFQRVDWQADAACKDLTPKRADRLFHHSGAVPAATLIMCGNCPVKQQCLNYGRDNGEEYGIWGGIHAAAIRAHTQPAAAVVIVVIKQPRVQLSDDNVRRIRSRRAAGETYTSIGLSFDIERTLVRKICLRLRFGHVEDIAQAA